MESFARRHLIVLIMLGGWCGVGCRPADDPSGASDRSAGTTGSALFVDVTDEAGIEFLHVNGATGDLYVPEIMGSGGAWLDVDHDGDLDLYLIQAGRLGAGDGPLPRNQLFGNDGGRFVDVTAESGLGDTGYGMGCCVGDVDNDGDDDVYVTNVGANRLFLNDGSGVFTDGTASAGVGHPGWGTSCAFVDYDRDGGLDLFVANYYAWSPEREKVCRAPDGRRSYCGPDRYDMPSPDVLYHNRGDGTFEDVTASAGLSKAFGNGLGVVWGDFNDDGWPDIYVGNDLNPNNLWINQGDGRFVDDALMASVDVNEFGKSEATMGIDARDVDRDGDLDLFMTHFTRETNTFYRNVGRGQFREATVQMRFNQWSLQPTSFGTMFFDYDHDGLLDLFVANGHVVVLGPTDHPYVCANTLVRQVSPGVFVDVTREAGPALRDAQSSRAALFGDYDNDGDLDILVTNCAGTPQLLRNDAAKQGHWLAVRAATGSPPRDAIGATVHLVLSDGTLRRDVRPAAGYCGSNDPRVHFGFGADSSPRALHVTWPDGSTEAFDVEGPDRFVAVQQGTGAMIEGSVP